MNKTFSLKTPDNVAEIKERYKQNELVYYSPLEELLNVLTHAVGIVFGFVMMVLMFLRASSPAGYATAALSSLGFISLFLNSSLYHGTTSVKTKKTLRRVDYASINLLVLSCGTGICLLYGNIVGYIIYAVCLAITVLVMFLCIRYFGKLRHSAIISNFVIGALFLAVFFIVRANIPVIAAQLYIAGTVLVLIGAALFGIKTKFIHTVFHVFVLVGPACFLLSNYFQL